jgi:3-oxoacyl-(acyl-carrier-protein) synthase
MYNPSAQVYVAGIGVVSAIGNNAAECFHALEKGQAGIGSITGLETRYRGHLPVGEVKLSNEELASITGLPVTASRTALLALLAAREAVEDAGMSTPNNLRVAFVSANSVGGMDKSEKFFARFLQHAKGGRLRNVVNHECGAVTELVADALSVKHHITTISTACSSGANSIFYAARLIRHGLADAVIAGGADALTSFTLNGFNTLQILDASPCMPFDENRRGLNLGEGAGYLVLVSEKTAAGLRANLYGRLTGYANANDAHHQTASSPDGTGAYLAMKEALERSGLQPNDISYINLHGTGTFNNDSSEGIAVSRIFSAPYPPMSSTKAYTGHTLAASGSIEAVFSLQALRRQVVYPSLRLHTPMAALPFVPVKTFRNATVKHVLSNSFGFGGNCSSLIFSKA